jgi:hypothetical protein
VLLGNYTDDVTLLGTLGQLASGFFNIDLPGDVRDLAYDLTHWDTTSKWQTLLDVVGLLPVVGDLKYVGDAGKLAEKALKNADEIGTLVKDADKAADAVDEAGTLVKDADKAADAVEKAYQDAAGGLAGDAEKTVEDISEDAGNKIDVSLQYKDGWTSEQKAAADEKLKVLSEANTVKTPVNRSGTFARTIYKRAYGNNSIPQGFDIDHKIDLQLGGSDKLENLWPLNRSVNHSLGKQINNYIKNYPIGTILGKFSIK